MNQLRHQILLAMGLGSLAISLLGCETEEKPVVDTDINIEDTSIADPLDIDDDGDGFTENEGDCDDTDSTIYEGADEVINDGIDQNCDGEDLLDSDLDGFAADVDCNDEDALIHPEAEEICDGIDNDCDGDADSGAIDPSTWYADTDQDEYGDSLVPMDACEQPVGYVADMTDCNDSDSSVYPGAEEIPDDRIDNNCDGDVDEIECPGASIPASASVIENNFESGNLIPYMFCEALPNNGACTPADQIDAYQLVNETVGSPTDNWCDWYITPPYCGPTGDVASECCYVFGVEPSCIAVGRPLTINGEARTANVIGSKDWTRKINADFSDLSVAQKDYLLQEWLRAAREEHASIASFARFALELLSLGAPPDLLAGATRAQADEIAHARSCFAVASQIAGRELGPAELDVSGALSESISTQDVMINIIIEGCINETLAAAEAAWLKERCSVPSIQKILAQIADDESRHAALAWKSLRWILQRNPELQPVAQDAFAIGKSNFVDTDVQVQADSWMTPFGRIPSQEGLRLRKNVWAKVIAPCAMVASTKATDKLAVQL